MTPFAASAAVFVLGLSATIAAAFWMIAVKRWLLLPILTLWAGVSANSLLTLATYSYAAGTCAPLYKPVSPLCPDHVDNNP